jgi:DNA-binding transcriptional ArsR family regulator
MALYLTKPHLDDIMILICSRSPFRSELRMGDLVAGQPALQIATAVSLPLDFVSFLSLLHRAVPGSGLDPYLIAARESLSEGARSDLDLLHGFSGPLLYYPEEPVMRFAPLRSDRRDAGFEHLREFIAGLPPEAFIEMAAHALQRVHADLEMRWQRPTDEASWRRALIPALTTARLDDVLALIANPAELKRRTLGMFDRLWEDVYCVARAAVQPVLEEAAYRGMGLVQRGFSEAYAALTGQRIPDVLERPPASISRIVFCPSGYLGDFVSFIAYVPDLVVFYAAPQFIERNRAAQSGHAWQANSPGPAADPAADLLEIARALADPTRLRMIELLLGGELYAQEIVGKLSVVQSAVSRHLGQLERAGLVTVKARRGSKYYAVNPAKLETIAAGLREWSARARDSRPVK